MELEFPGVVFTWRGPSPFYFVAVPEEESAQLEAVSAMVSYGWGMIPVTGRIGTSDFSTALWPKDGGYVVPIKAGVRRVEGLDEGSRISVRLTVAV